MNESDNFQEQETLKDIAKAQKTLEDVESKMKKFKSKKRQKSQSTINKAPFPDLNNNEFQNQQEGDELLLNQIRTRNNSKDVVGNTVYNITKPRFQEKQNQSISINQKLQKQKNSSINKIQEYYIQRNEALEQKIRELKLMKQKIIKDQKLLIRNNQELENELQRQRSVMQESSRIVQLKSKIQKMKEKIANTESDNNKLNLRKKDLEKHVKQILKTHKQSMSQQLLFRPKSTSAVVRCQYH